MKFKSVEIENFKAIKKISMDDLADFIVIAGPNGCGKSSIFDAIRFLKSIYGGYQPNELQHWFSEFQLNMGQGNQLLSLFQDRGKPVHISAEITLSKEEVIWIKENAFKVFVESMMRANMQNPHGFNPSLFMGLQEQAAQKTEKLLSQLEKSVYLAKMRIAPDLNISYDESEVLSFIYGLYLPNFIGVIDYHGAQRNYHREQIGGINLNLDALLQQQGQHALYNYSNKYTNVKTELASNYVRELIREKAVGINATHSTLSEALKELFATFFNGKEFMDVQPTDQGNLLFNVRTRIGIHDINELSSGEKEILYGYLRLLNTAPKNSVIMIDEPELHLNPRLTRGLTEFYYRHLGKSLDNQIWMVTHSDSILREAIANTSFDVFHMMNGFDVNCDDNQMRRVSAEEELERAIIDLVGDVAIYKPDAKLIVLEGGGDSEFDSRVIAELFPDFASQVNLLSGENKKKVRDLHNILQKASEQDMIPIKVYSIADNDFGEEDIKGVTRAFKWDCYHIENYLLEPSYIKRVLEDIGIKKTENDIENELKKCAQRCLNTIVIELMEQKVNRCIVNSIKTKIDPKSKNVATELENVIERSMERIIKVRSENLTRENLISMEQELFKQFSESFLTDEWKKKFKGREILKQYVSEYTGGKVSYLVFRDLILSRMRDSRYQPGGMNKVIESIINDG